MKKIIFLFIILFSSASYTYAFTGAIDTSATNTAKVCKDVSCASPTPGTINFELSAVPSIVVDSVTGISGYVWGDELGWILLNPTGQGVSFSNTTTGLLTGKAWSQVSGWINFAPTGQSVTINPTTGEFSGWAWTGGPYGGWIKFDCGDSSTCVRTTWKPSSSSGGSGGGGGGGALIDVCPNIPEAQQSIPVGYTVNAEGQCVTVAIDMCPNLLGEQTTIPEGYSVNPVGACVFIDVDFCPNIKGNQTAVPSGYTINASGNCVTKTQQDLCPSVEGIQTSYELCKKNPAVDACSNIPGLQSTVPVGYTESTGQCFPETYDVCPNIEGAQIAVPDSYTVGANGDCVFLPFDMCSNLAGYQNEVPRGFRQEGQTCIFETQNTGESTTTTNGETIKTIGFPFIPKSIYIPSDNTFLKSVAKIFNTKDTAKPFRVDAVSGGVGVTGLLLVLLLLIRLVRKVL